jgi:hypothetical protein
MLVAISLCLAKVISSFTKVTQVTEDTDLLVNINGLQSELADSTFVISLAVT